MTPRKSKRQDIIEVCASGLPLTMREAADILALSQETIRRHIASGLLPAFRVGHRWRIPQAGLISLMTPAKGAA